MPSLYTRNLIAQSLQSTLHTLVVRISTLTQQCLHLHDDALFFAAHISPHLVSMIEDVQRDHVARQTTRNSTESLLPRTWLEKNGFEKVSAAVEALGEEVYDEGWEDWYGRYNSAVEVVLTFEGKLDELEKGMVKLMGFELVRKRVREGEVRLLRGRVDSGFRMEQMVGEVTFDERVDGNGEVSFHLTFVPRWLYNHTHTQNKCIYLQAHLTNTL